MEYVNEKLLEFEKFLINKKVAIIGLGVSNFPLIDYLYEKNVNVVVFDEKNQLDISKDAIDKIKKYSLETYFGKDCLENLKGFNVIFRSPSLLPTNSYLAEEEKNGALITTEVELLLNMAPCKVIGITGSDGKTTTTSLIYEIIKYAGYNCYVGGNIGIPLFTKLNKIKPEDIIILELSSFQLMGMEVSPDISVITNITPNHLNIHKDYEEYIEAKKNIFKYQDKNGILITNFDNEITSKIDKSEVPGEIIYFSSKNKLDDGYIIDENVIKKCDNKLRTHILNVNDVKLRGMHNFENIATALAATEKMVKQEVAIEAIKNFNGVEHRLELIKDVDGVKWYNDSVSSSPTRTIAGLYSYDENIILIAGGYDKNLDYTPIAKPIVDKVGTLILIGQTSEKIYNAVKDELNNQHKNIDIFLCDDLEQTVLLSKKYSKEGDIVLFSPASASFDMFKNFADRGEKFKELVKNKI